MALRSKILNKINKALNRFRVYRGEFYKRFIVSSGDPLLSKNSSIKNDLPINPKPAIFYPKYQGISQNNDPFKIGNIVAQVGDVVCLLSADAITESELLDPTFCFVNIFDQYEEEFYIVASDRINVEGDTVAYQFLLRSRIRK